MIAIPGKLQEDRNMGQGSETKLRSGSRGMTQMAGYLPSKHEDQSSKNKARPRGANFKPILESGCLQKEEELSEEEEGQLGCGRTEGIVKGQSFRKHGKVNWM